MYRFSLVLSLFIFIFQNNTIHSYELTPAKTKVPITSKVNILNEVSRGLSAVAKHTKKALVFISVSQQSKRRHHGSDPFEFFFGVPRQQMEAPKREGLGSGFIIDLEKGYILTNNHVIENADTINLKLANSESYSGRIIGRDKHTDIAVVQITDKKYKKENLSELVLGDSNQINVASFVMALGAPFGLEASISVGVISATGRGSLEITQMGDFIQTDAAINPGNSGGPLVNMEGKVIGINTAIYSRSGGYNGIGFAVPSNLVRKVANDLINGGHSTRGYLGIRYQVLMKDWISSLGLPKNIKGVIVAQVSEGGPAKKAGMKIGDVITKINSVNIENGQDLSKTISFMKPGSKAKITLFREGSEKTIQVTIQDWPGSKSLASSPQANSTNQHGLAVSSINKELKRHYKLTSSKGLVVTEVKARTQAAQHFIEGDHIRLVNGLAISDPKDLEKILTKSQGLTIFHVERDNESFLVALKAP